MSYIISIPTFDLFPLNTSGAVLLSNVQSLVPVHSINLTCTGSENSLTECQDTSLAQGCAAAFLFSPAAIRCQGQFFCQSLKIFTNIHATAAAQCNDGDLHLFGGDNQREGNLQICFNQVWGSVCHNRGDFSIDEARVACNQLGYNPSGKIQDCATLIYD